jgi:hypothetical protein
VTPTRTLQNPVRPLRLALSRAAAAEALGMSLSSFERHVLPEIKVVRRGSLRLVPVRELERWLEREAEGL